MDQVQPVQATTPGQRVCDLFDDLTAETYFGWNFRYQLIEATVNDPQFVDKLEEFVFAARRARES